jgi:hypothetical protein
LAEAKAIAEKAEKDEAEIMATVSRVINGDK